MITTPVTKLVNQIGQWFYKNLDGSYDFDISPNMYDLYLTVLYQVPLEIIRKYKLENTKESDINEMDILMSITTYANKIRVNLVEKSPEEQTLQHFVLDPAKFDDLTELRMKILEKVRKVLNKKFDGYEFLF